MSSDSIEKLKEARYNLKIAKQTFNQAKNITVKKEQALIKKVATKEKIVNILKNKVEKEKALLKKSNTNMKGGTDENITDMRFIIIPALDTTTINALLKKGGDKEKIIDKLEKEKIIDKLEKDIYTYFYNKLFLPTLQEMYNDGLIIFKGSAKNTHDNIESFFMYIVLMMMDVKVNREKDFSQEKPFNKSDIYDMIGKLVGEAKQQAAKQQAAKQQVGNTSIWIVQPQSKYNTTTVEMKSKGTTTDDLPILDRKYYAQLAKVEVRNIQGMLNSDIDSTDIVLSAKTLFKLILYLNKDAQDDMT